MTRLTDEEAAARLRRHAARLAPPMHVDAAAAVAGGRRRRLRNATAVTGAAAAAVVLTAVAASTLAPRGPALPADAPTGSAPSTTAVGVVRPATGITASTGPGDEVGTGMPLGTLGGADVVYEPPRDDLPARVLVEGEERPITLPLGDDQVLGVSTPTAAGGRLAVQVVPGDLAQGRVFLVSDAGWETPSGRTVAVELPTFALPDEASGLRYAVYHVAEPALGTSTVALVGLDGTYVTPCGSAAPCTLPAPVLEELGRLTDLDGLRAAGG